MKNLFTLALVAICINFTACDELDELTEFDVSTTLTQSVSVLVEDGEFSDSITIDLAENPDIQENLDRIESVTIDGAIYKVTQFIGPSTTTGTTIVSAAGQEFGPFNHMFESDLSSGKEFLLGTSDMLESLRANLSSNNQLIINLEGSVSEDVDELEFTIEMDVTVTVDAV